MTYNPAFTRLQKEKHQIEDNHAGLSSKFKRLSCEILHVKEELKIHKKGRIDKAATRLSFARDFHDCVERCSQNLAEAVESMLFFIIDSLICIIFFPLVEFECYTTIE